MAQADQVTSANMDEYIREVNDYRDQTNEFFRTDNGSPIPPAQRATFGGLRYFAPDPAYRVVARALPFAEQPVVQLGSTKGDVRPQVRFADLQFTLDGQDVHLTGYQDVDPDDGNALFVPFRDATTGKETYGAGRYLEVEMERDERDVITVALDFNLAYNPWCAYNPAYSCTLPPVENTLDVAVRAGEQTPAAHE